MSRHFSHPPANRQWAAELFLPVALLLLALLTAAAYWPGLSGPFLFDDFSNLDALGQYGGVRDLETLRLFILGSHSGPTGRPLALLTFLLDSNTWPTDPRPFKVTNLALHLVNGTILFALTRQLLLLSGKLSTKRCTFSALLAAGAWLLHPFLVSTVLYVVQRMAMLSTLFVLMGLWGYTYGRLQLAEYPRRAYVWMSASLAGCTILAVLSKENGVLLPLLALILEFTLLGKHSSTRLNKRWSIIFLWIPATLPFAYIAYRTMNGSLVASFMNRSFDVWERLLTESRILFDYLGWWFYPRVHSPGLLIQNYPLSHSLFDPPVTILAVSEVVSLIMAAVLLHKKYPLFSLAILFFFAAHLLESGPLPLELYFEHRNYLPTIFLFLPLMAALSKPSARYRSLVIIGPAILMALALLTFQRASIWGDIERLADSWADSHPYSQRAQRYSALVAEA